MLIRIKSAKCIGIEAVGVSVEIDISSGIGIHLVGLADTAVKESLLRTVTALQSLGFRIPGRKIVINLAPADIHKRGSVYDLPIALGIIAASEQVEMPDLEKYVIMGELGLNGEVRAVAGALPVAEMAGSLNDGGCMGCIMPYLSAMEASEMKQCKVFGVHTLQEAIDIVCRHGDYAELEVTGRGIKFQGGRSCRNDDIMDFSEIVGQDIAKRGLEIAAAGSHNVILIGAPGSGKSSLAKAMAGILPPMTDEEAIQTSKIYSVAGKGGLADGLIRTRPFRAPHISSSVPALIGGGSDSIIPGEISLAHNGILFLDEFCEIPRKTIEVLRGPMEDRKVTISRLRSKVEYPAEFTLVAATNPCPCGFYGESDRCTCSVSARNAYLGKLSGPLMDRIDLQIWTHSICTKELMAHRGTESSAVIAERVRRARKIQLERFSVEEIFCNSQMNNRLLRKFCPLSPECSDFLEKAGDRMGLSARATTRIIKIARTIADLAASPDIKVEHLAEALSFRLLDKQMPAK